MKNARPSKAESSAHNTPENTTPEQGEQHQQQELFEIAFNPSFPSSNTNAGRTLRRLLTGERLNQISFGLHAGWRLAAYVRELRDLGWPVQACDIAPPPGYKTGKPIRQYWLTNEIIAAALALAKEAA